MLIIITLATIYSIMEYTMRKSAAAVKALQGAVQSKQ
jgi:hypothetical protein